jgi:hypothetical protein
VAKNLAKKYYCAILLQPSFVIALEVTVTVLGINVMAAKICNGILSGKRR